MPVGNNFQYSQYVRSDPTERVRYREIQPTAAAASPAWLDAMARHGVQLHAAGVRAILFVHGTHLGTDVFGMQRLDDLGGLRRGYSRGISGLDALLALMREDSNGFTKGPGGQNPPFTDDDRSKGALDNHVLDAANFTASYVSQLEAGINREVPNPIACLRTLWSAEHHHLGRSLAAYRLLIGLQALVSERHLQRGDRMLVQAHGHAGQVMALVSNLLAPGELSGRKALMNVLTAYLEHTREDPQMLERMKGIEALLPTGGVLNGVMLDVVTLGTPVRYGWDPSGLGKLLHIVNHRPMRQDGKRWLAKMELPQITMEMPVAWGGDYVQQLAVAGCDAVPASPEAKEANKALWEILEPLEGFERWLECARRCVRCANDGQCLLVDYKDATGSANALEHVYGHAAYTRLGNLLFNTGEIVQALYATEDG